MTFVLLIYLSILYYYTVHTPSGIATLWVGLNPGSYINLCFRGDALNDNYNFRFYLMYNK